MTLRKVRQTAKVKIQDIDLDRRTIAKIEKEDCNVQLCSLKKYLAAIDMEIKYCLK